MKLLGIISEYNPFHNGHRYHIQTAKKQSGCTHVMALMSGSCVQRGEFTVGDKWTRAESAVKNGIDLVCELPFVYAAQTAEIFAGGVSLLNACQCDMISFGTETDDFDALIAIADFLAEEPETYKKILKTLLSEGKSFAKARQDALQFFGLKSELLTTPNNILAVEYIKALIRVKCQMEICPVKRLGNGFHSEKIDNDYPSASAIRHAIISGNHDKIRHALPYPSDFFSKEKILTQKQNVEDQILALLLKSTPESLKALPDVSEGLEFALLNSLKKTTDLSEIIAEVSSKRIPRSRVRRILLHLLMNYQRTDFQSLSLPLQPHYLRVLAFNDNGREIIKSIKESSDIPIITNLYDQRVQLDKNAFQALKYDCLSTDMFYLTRGEKEFIHADYRNHPRIIK